MIPRTIRVAALTLALATALTPISPASAGDGENYPPHLRCLDVTHGEGTLSIQGATLLGSTYGDTVTFSIDLGAPSCASGAYRVDVIDNDAAGTPLASLTQAGDGATTLEFSIAVAPDEDGCVHVQVHTMDSRGRTLDAAPDDGSGGGVGEGCPPGGSVWR